jgi:hypothetical protein
MPTGSPRRRGRSEGQPSRVYGRWLHATRVVSVTATRKIGRITDTLDLPATEPLLLLTRDPADGFTTRLDNTARYAAR